MKFMNEFALRPGTQEEYRRRHDEIWPEMRELIAKAGLKNYSIWCLGTRLIEYFETDDLEQTRYILRESQVKSKWDIYMSDILVLKEDGSMDPLTLMFECN